MSHEPIVYLNGEYLPASQARVSLADWGLHGVAATEMTRTFRGRCFRLDDHLDRLNDSLRRLGIDVDLLRDEWTAMTHKVVEHHAALLGGEGELLVNHLVTAGINPVYAAATGGGPTVCVQTFPLRFSRWAAQYSTGQHLVVPETRQVPPQCIDPRIKSRNRLHWYLADRQAREQADGAAALLLDLDGHLTETSFGNFYIVRAGTILTPRYEKTLGGVSRRVVADIARFLGVPFEQADLTVDDALSADEVFTSSTPYCVLPVTKLNDTVLGDGRPGPLYQQILETWNTMVGLDIAAQARSQAAET